MRSLSSHVAVVVLSVVLSAAAVAAPRTEPVRSRPVQAVTKLIRALGDFITIPIPAPAPRPQQQP